MALLAYANSRHAVAALVLPNTLFPAIEVCYRTNISREALRTTLYGQRL
jgi:hypothetical protein